MYEACLLSPPDSIKSITPALFRSTFHRNNLPVGFGAGEGNHKKMTRRQSSPPVYKQAKAPSQVWQKLCSVTVNDAWHLMLDIDLESWREGRSSIPGLYLNFTFVQANFIQWNGQILGPRLREHNPGPETAGM